MSEFERRTEAGLVVVCKCLLGCGLRPDVGTDEWEWRALSGGVGGGVSARGFSLFAGWRVWDTVNLSLLSSSSSSWLLSIFPSDRPWLWLALLCHHLITASRSTKEAAIHRTGPTFHLSPLSLSSSLRLRKQTNMATQPLKGIHL